MVDTRKQQKEVPPAAEAGQQERLVIGSAALDAKTLSEKVLIAPWGEVRSANGTFVVDDESGRLVIAAFKAHGTDVPIDYEHQSLGGPYASPTGQAPAAGWIKNLHYLPPEEAGDAEAGLVAEVAWTDPARQKLAAREYRYLSPVVLVRKADRKVVALHSAALTNKPAIVGMRPIVNRQDVAAEREILQEVAEESDRADQAVEALRLRLNLPADCDLDELLIAAEQRLAAMAAEAAAAEADRRVAEVLAAGKLTPNQREWAGQLALKDPAAFDAWAATAVPVVPLGRTRGPARVVCGGKDRTAVIASARAAFRAEAALAGLTSEQAWVAEALREAGFEPQAAQSVELE